MAKYALIIGVSNYVQCSKIPSCDTDASDFKQVITSKKEYGYSQGDIVLMTSQNKGDLYPSKSNIENQIRRLFRGASNDDSVLIFFSGHGANINDNQYLCPMDCVPTDIHGSAVSLSMIKAELNKSLAKIKLIFLDACHSGEDSRGLKGPLSGFSSEILITELGEMEGCAIFGSCKIDEVSYALKGERNSLWASEILALLNNPTQILNGEQFLLLSHIAEHVTIKVKSYSRKNCPSVQSPVLYSNCSGSIIIGDFRPEFSDTSMSSELLKSSNIIVIYESIKDVKDILGAENSFWDPSTSSEEELLDSLETVIKEEKNGFLRPLRTSIRTEGLASRSDIIDYGDEIKFTKGSISFEANLIENQRKLQFKKIVSLSENQSESFDTFIKICLANLDKVTLIEFIINKDVNFERFLDAFETSGGIVIEEDNEGFEGQYQKYNIGVRIDAKTGNFIIQCSFYYSSQVKRFFEQDTLSELAQIVAVSFIKV